MQGENYASHSGANHHTIREPVKTKLRDYLGVFPKCRTPPPPPPYLGGLRPKNPKNPKIQKIQKIQKKLKHVLAP